jgi:hypothetical protein
MPHLIGDMAAQYVDSELLRPAKWVCVEAHLPGQFPTKIGIILLEADSDTLHVRIKPFWWEDLVGVDEEDIWQLLSEDLTAKAEKMGAAMFFDWFEDCCSHSLRMGDPQANVISEPETFVNRLYREYVDKSETAALVVNKPGATNLLSRGFTSLRQSLPTRAMYTPLRDRGWRAQAALAASLLAGAWVAGYHSSYTGEIQQRIPSLSATMELPLPSAFRYQHVQLNLSSDWGAWPHRLRRRKRRPAVVVRQFVIAPRLAKYQEVQIAIEQPPLLPAINTTMPEAVPPHLLSEPELPASYSRRNRFVRVLAAVTIPFRLVASR